MLFEALQLLAGRQHQVHALVLMRGETFIETIEPGASGQRDGSRAGLHMTPRAGDPVWLTTAGTYCVTAREPVIGVRMIRLAGGGA